MSPLDKAAAERAYLAVRRELDAFLKAPAGPPLSIPARQFPSDPEWNLAPLSAELPASAAVLLFTDGAEFEIDGDLYWMEAIHRSRYGPQADVLVIRRQEFTRCPERPARRAIQVRDLEALIDQDRVDIAFGPTARQFNIARGWCYGGRTLAFYGIVLDGVGPRPDASRPQWRQDGCE